MRGCAVSTVGGVIFSPIMVIDYKLAILNADLANVATGIGSGSFLNWRCQF
jgi:hypothetical protein